MCLIHHLTDCLIITSFESVANVKNTLHLTDYIFCPEEILLRNEVAHFLQPYTFRVAEEFHIAMVLSDGSAYVLARLTSLVVCR